MKASSDKSKDGNDVSTDSAGGPETDSHGPNGATESEPREIGGREGPDPTRYGDWEKNGRCIDF